MFVRSVELTKINNANRLITTHMIEIGKMLLEVQVMKKELATSKYTLDINFISGKFKGQRWELKSLTSDSVNEIASWIPDKVLRSAVIYVVNNRKRQFLFDYFEIIKLQQSSKSN